MKAVAASRSHPVSATTASTAILWASIGFLLAVSTRQPEHRPTSINAALRFPAIFADSQDRANTQNNAGPIVGATPFRHRNTASHWPDARRFRLQQLSRR